MKIYRKMYNRETKDCELLIEFSDREYSLIKDKGFIQEEYICLTSIPAMYNADISSGIIKLGMRHTNNIIIPFEYEYCEWSCDIHELEHNIIFCEGHKFVYGNNVSLETVQKRFIWDLINNNILKFN